MSPGASAANTSAWPNRVRRFGQALVLAAEAPYPVRGGVSQQIGDPCSPCQAITLLSPRYSPGAPGSHRLLVQIFRQIEAIGADPGMHRMCLAIGRVAQRDYQYSKAALFKRQDLLRDEGFGEARVALEDKGDPPQLRRRSAHLTPSCEPAPRAALRGPGRAISSPAG